MCGDFLVFFANKSEIKREHTLSKTQLKHQRGSAGELVSSGPGGIPPAPPAALGGWSSLESSQTMSPARRGLLS